MPEMLSRREVEQLAGLSKADIAYRVKIGQLPAPVVKTIGTAARRSFWERKDVEAWIQSHGAQRETERRRREDLNKKRSASLAQRAAALEERSQLAQKKDREFVGLYLLPEITGLSFRRLAILRRQKKFPEPARGEGNAWYPQEIETWLKSEGKPIPWQVWARLEKN